jgi:hypothetical protein
MTQQGGGGPDPLALWGAVTGTIGAIAGLLALGLEVGGAFRDRSKLTARLETDFPDSWPDRESDLGGDPGEAHARLEITNTGRRPITLRVAGMEFFTDPVAPGRVERLLRRLRLKKPRLTAFNFTERRQWVSKTLAEGEPWVLLVPYSEIEEGFWALIGPTGVAGLFAETSTGRRIRWGRQAVHSKSLLDLNREPYGSPYEEM